MDKQMSTDLKPLLLSPRQAAKALSVCEKTLYNRTKAGELPVVRIGRAAWISTDIEGAAQNPAQYAAAREGNGQKTTTGQNRKNAGFPVSTAACKSLQDKHLETKGIEPSFWRCDRHVLPLHHVPRDNHECYFTRYRSDVNCPLSSSYEIS